MVIVLTMRNTDWMRRKAKSRPAGVSGGGMRYITKRKDTQLLYHARKRRRETEVCMLG